MIFITVGSSKLPFERLVRQADVLATYDDVLVQRGPCVARFEHAKSVDFLSYEDLIECMSAARIVVTHAGVGSIIAALSTQTRPIVVPRRRAWHEAVDDHQVELARRLSSTGFVTALETPSELVKAIQDPGGGLTDFEGDGALALEIRGILTEWVEDSAAGAAPRR